jgi:hypothetical protein
MRDCVCVQGVFVQDFDGVAVDAFDVCDQAYVANDWTAFQLAADSVKTIAK